MTKILILLLCCVTANLAQNLVQYTCSNKYVDVEMTGANAIINGIFSMRNPGAAGYGCGAVAEDQMQIFEAARFALQKVNSKVNFIPGVKIGMRAYDDCMTPEIALKAATDSFPQHITEATYCSKQTPLNLGLLGALTSDASIAISRFAGKFNAAVISQRAASSALSNKNMFPSFLRTTPSTNAQAIAMVKMLTTTLTWKKILLVHTDTSYGRSGKEEVLNAAYLADICVAHSLELPSAGSVQDYANLIANLNQYGANAAIFFGTNSRALKLLEALNNQPALGQIQWIFSDISPTATFPANVRSQRGAIVVKSQKTDISEFQTYFTNFVTANQNTATNPVGNPWFREWYKPGYTYSQNYYVDTTIRAVYAYAKALKDAHRALCGGVSGVCDSLRRMTPTQFLDTYVKTVDYTFDNTDGMTAMTGQRIAFDVNGNPVKSDFTFWNYNRNSGSFRFENVGGYVDGNTNIAADRVKFFDASRQTELAAIPTSTCPAIGCSNCFLPSRELTYSYSGGDIDLLMIASSKYSGSDPLTCGKTSDNGSQMSLALKYALQSVKTRFSTILRGVTLGMLMADPCSDSLAAESFVSNLWGGRKVYSDSQGKPIDPSKIKAVIQTSTYDVTKRVARVNSLFEVADIGITSATEMDKQEMYPYYTQYHPSDDVVIDSMIATIQRFQWSNVQIVSTANEYFTNFVNELKKRAAIVSICVVAEHHFDQDDPAPVVDNLRLMAGQANVVITLGTSEDIRSLLNGMRRRNAAGEFLLMGVSTTFNIDATEDYGPETNGSLVITPAVNTNSGFDTFLRLSSTSQIRSDPVFASWYEKTLDCYLGSANPNNYLNPCSNAPITTSPRYQQKLIVPFVINSVYTMAQALHKALEMVCGVNYNGVCAAFRSGKYAKHIHDALQNQNFQDGASNTYEIVNGKVMTNFKVMSYRLNQQNQEIAVFSTKTRHITSFNSINFVTPVSVKASCTGPCKACHYIYKYEPFIYQPADILIGGLFSVSRPSGTSPYKCGDVRQTNGFQYTAAMLYALEQVNNGKAPVSLRGNLTVGGLALDHCQTATRPTGLLSGIYSGLFDYAWARDDMYKGLMSEKISAWMMDDSFSAAESSEFLEPLNVPIVSPSATATSLKEFSQFFRTVQGDDATATAVLRLSRSLGFNYLQAVGSNSVYGKSGVSTLKSIGQLEGVCVTKSFEIGTDGDYAQIITSLVNGNSDVVVVYLSTSDFSSLLDAKRNNPAASSLIFITPEEYSSNFGSRANNLLSLKILSTNLNGYRDYLTRKTAEGYTENVFFRKYYSELEGCNLPGYYKAGRTDCPDTLRSIAVSSSFKQDNYVISTMDSVYSIVAAIDATLKQLCGEDYDTICSAYGNHRNINDLIQQNLNTVSFKDPANHEFRFQDRDGNIPYVVQRYNGITYEQFGTYKGTSIKLDETLKTIYSNVKAECTEQCIECIQSGVTFTYVPGDIMLGGLFDVHEKSVNPFLCGKVNTLHGFQLLEAFHYALGLVNGKQGIFADKLQGVQVGGIGLDGCQSAIRSGFLVSNIHNGMVSLVKNGKTIDPKDIDAYIGTYSSDSSIYVNRILNDLNIPQISYASSSTQLKDQLRYPYFYRTVPADDNQAEAMANFLDKHNIRYVQVLYTDTSYGMLGSKAFEEAASRKRICVAQMVSYPNEGIVSNEISNDVVTALLQNPVANTVVVFAGTDYINALLRAVGRVVPVNGTSPFKFIGSETWGNSEDAFIGSERYASGSVTLGLETDNLKVFDDYIGKKTPLNSQGNPWFSEYYEEIWNCYLSVPSVNRQRECAQTAISIPLSRQYTQDPGVLHVINAVFSSSLALDKALTEVCGVGYTTVCEAYKNRKDRRDVLMKKLDSVEFTDLSGSNFTFENREGNKGYNFYSITAQSVTSGYIYTKIGSYDTNGVMDINAQYKPSWDGSCERDDACSECPTVRNSQQRYTVMGETSAPRSTFISVFDIHKMGLDEFRCGDLDINGGFLEYLAYLYTMDNVLGASSSRFRGLVLDTCSNNLRVEQDIYNILAYSTLCNSLYDVTPPVLAKSVGGLLVAKDGNTESAARVLEPLKYSYVSPSATSIRFNDLKRYTYLARTIQPRNELLKKISDLFKENKWTYISTFVSFNSNENDAYKTFTELVTANDVCMGTPFMATDPMDETTALNALRNQFESNSARVVVLFTTLEDTRTLLIAANNLGYLKQYFWVFTNVWASDMTEHKMKLNLPAGYTFKGLVIYRKSSAVVSFKEYMKNTLKYEETSATKNSKNIPREWFEEFYQKTHQCKLEDAISPDLEFTNLCSKKEEINEPEMNNDYILNTIAGTYAMVKGVDKFMTESCTANENLAECAIKIPNAREMIRTHILSFTADLNKEIALDPNDKYELSFNKQQFWSTGYNVKKFEDYNTGQDSGADKLGNWASTCPKDEDGIETEACGCPVKAAVASPTSDKQTGGVALTPGPRNWYYYSDGDKLYEWPLWAIVVAVLTSLGILVSVIVFVYLLIAYPNRGGTSILGYLAIVGIICIYVLNFAFFFHASLETCTTRRLLMGIVYAIVFGPLLVKAVDNWFRKDSEYAPEQYHGITSSFALLLMSIAIVLIQAIIPIEWLILVRPTASKSFNSDVHDYWWCDPPSDYDVGLVLSMIFIMFLVLLTAIFSGLTWESWRNNYESRWICISAVCTAGCMFVWMIVVTNAGAPYRDAAVTIGNFVNATALLICIPLRKMIIVCSYRDKKDDLTGGQEMLYQDIYENPSFDPDFPLPSKHGSDTQF